MDGGSEGVRKTGSGSEGDSSGITISEDSGGGVGSIDGGFAIESSKNGAGNGAKKGNGDGKDEKCFGIRGGGEHLPRI